MQSNDKRALARVATVLVGAGLVKLALSPPAPARTGSQEMDEGGELARVADSIAEVEDRRSTPLQPGETVDPNTATEIDLDRLPGVGQSKAAAIVSERAESGPFLSVDGMLRVPGLGPKSLERLRPFLSLSNPAKGGSQPRRRLVVKERLGRPSSLVVDVNRASAQELASLPGLGRVLAERVVAFRSENGAFRTVGDLTQVPGIGSSRLEQLKRYVVVRP